MTHKLATGLASREFLAQLQALYPSDPRETLKGSNPWYLIAAVTFSGCNKPEAVSRLLEYILEENTASSEEEKREVVRRFREAIFKSGLIIGYPRSINGLVKLREVTPNELCDKMLLRDVRGEDTVQKLIDRGDTLFNAMYRDTAPGVQALLEDIHPDMGWFSKNIAYGLVYSNNQILSQVETSYVIVAGLIAMDTPRQIGWHLQNCIHGGATLEEARAVREIAMEVARHCGLVWEEEVPDLKG